MLLISFILFLIIFLRYMVSSFLIELFLSKRNFSPVIKLKRKADQRRIEITNALFSSIIFAIAMSGLYFLWQAGVLNLAKNMPIWYHPLSILLALLLHETYYYWLHRLMHHKRVYSFLHKGHHDSVVVSAWTSFSFDWAESILQAFAFYLIVFLIPLHLYSILFLLIFMTLSAIINHLNIEIYPKNFKTHFIFKHFIGATHHALHHKEFKSNYGLYFTFWDKWMGTESKNY